MTSAFLEMWLVDKASELTQGINQKFKKTL